MKKQYIALILCAAMAGTMLTGCKSDDYKNAAELIGQEKYEAAKELLEPLGDYKDSVELVKECNYQIAVDKLSEGDFDGAVTIFESIKDYKDVSAVLSALKSPCDGVSDEAYFYMTKMVDYMSDSEYRANLKKSISDRVDSMFDGDYNGTSGDEIMAMLWELDQTTELMNTLETHTGTFKYDKKYSECVLAYYFLTLDNVCAELYEDSDHSVYYGLMCSLWGLDTDEIYDLDTYLASAHDEFYKCKSIDDIKYIIFVSMLTPMGYNYDWPD